MTSIIDYRLSTSKCLEAAARPMNSLYMTSICRAVPSRQPQNTKMAYMAESIPRCSFNAE
jgi:hypothetical protein